MNIKQTGTFTQPVYQTLLIAVCGGYVWVGQSAPANSIAKAGNQATPPLTSTGSVSMAYINLHVYLVDGMSSTIAVYNTSIGNMETFTPASSTALPPTFCGLACNWRGRLVLAGDKNNPQNFYMSRAGTPNDFDYSQLDPAAAVAGNLSKSGQIGEPITALIPYTDDYMLIGCTHSLWMLQGDPADGGSIVQVSNQMGIVGPNAWCIDPAGTLYYVATGGLYSVKPIWEMYQPPQLLTGESYNQFFAGLGWSSIRTNLVWDADLHYMHIFCQPTNGTTGANLTFDTRSGGLWPLAFPPNIGPASATLFMGDASANDRAVLLGGTDGYIRTFDPFAINDDGVAIQSNVTFGPYKPFPDSGVLTGCTIDLGELSQISLASGVGTWNTDVTILAGATAYDVTEGAPHSSTAINCTLDRRQKTFRQRLRGGWFAVKLSNATADAYFSFESAVMEFEPGGRNRDRR